MGSGDAVQHPRSTPSAIPYLPELASFRTGGLKHFTSGGLRLLLGRGLVGVRFGTDLSNPPIPTPAAAQMSAAQHSLRP